MASAAAAAALFASSESNEFIFLTSESDHPEMNYFKWNFSRFLLLSCFVPLQKQIFDRKNSTVFGEYTKHVDYNLWREKNE